MKTRLALAGLLALTACDPGATPDAPPGAPSGAAAPAPRGALPGRAVIERDPPPTRPVEVGEPVATDLRPAAEVTARPRRRMDLDQLKAAVLQASGGTGWMETRGNTEVDLFDELAATLGRPDYFQVTTEDLEPSALFLKFLDDAARSVCGRIVEADFERADDERVLLRGVQADGTDDDAAIDANLQRLVRRFHGHTLDAGSLATWRWLRASVDFVTGDPVVSWQSVCVALYTHPDFYSY
ncbi:MAG: hypothetical protein H6706_28115 [Myxococcales bacterium]|nr:hypothetical protein [Myxococcales bacterium]